MITLWLSQQVSSICSFPVSTDLLQYWQLIQMISYIASIDHLAMVVIA